MAYTDKELESIRATSQTEAFYAERNGNAKPGMARLIERLDAAEAVCALAYANGSIFEDEVSEWLDARVAK